MILFSFEIKNSKHHQKYLEINPTILSGWNIDGFDVPYLYRRLARVLGQEEANRLSPIGHAYFHPFKKRIVIAGVSCLDYLVLYKNFTYSVEPTYRLDAIGRKEVGIGKIEYEGNLDDLFSSDIEKFIEYNLNDVKIVVEIDKKMELTREKKRFHLAWAQSSAST